MEMAPTERLTSQTAEHVVVKYDDEDPEHQPRANDHGVAQCWVEAREVPVANFGAVTDHKVVLEKATSEDREQ